MTNDQLDDFRKTVGAVRSYEDIAVTVVSNTSASYLLFHIGSGVSRRLSYRPFHDGSQELGVLQYR